RSAAAPTAATRRAMPSVTWCGAGICAAAARCRSSIRPSSRISTAPATSAAEASVSDRVEHLLREMTLEEKLGQINMIDAGAPRDGVPEMERQIRAGGIGSVFNVYGAEKTDRLQRIAVDESRRKIPLIFGLDVLHGHRTIFPIPLAEACAFAPELWQHTAAA